MLWRGPMGGGAASGKIGAMIASHCAQGQYLKHRVKCVNPRTELQHPLRNALRSLASMWGTTLTATQRAGWATYAANVTWVNRLGDTVHLSGQMEFCRSNWPRFQIQLPLVLDAPVIFDRGSTGGGTLTISVGDDFGVLLIAPAPPWQDGSTLTACMVYMGLPRSGARTFMAPRTQLSAVLLGTFGALTAFPPLQPRGTTAQYHQAYPAWLVATFSDGRLTTPTPLTPVFTGPPPPPPWEDAFPYPDGPIDGLGGWVSPITFYDAADIVSHTFYTAGHNSAAHNTSPGIPTSWAVPWTVEIDFNTTTGDDAGGNIFVETGDLTDQTTVTSLNWNPGDLALDQIGQLYLITQLDSFIIQLFNVPCTANTTHTLTIQYDGSNYTLLLDAVPVGTAPGSAVAGIRSIQIGSDNTFGTDAYRVERIYAAQN